MLGKQCIARTQESEQSTHTSVMTSEDMQSIHNNASNTTGVHWFMNKTRDKYVLNLHQHYT